VAFLDEVVGYLHATFFYREGYREGNIPLRKCIMTLKQDPVMCIAFL
jgi:hypothetical protein